jgi:hypothetical protein
MNTNSKVKFYLQMKKRYESIERFLENIISEYQDLINLSNDNNVGTEYLRDFLKEYTAKKYEVLLLKQQINYDLNSCCQHDFIRDTIDSGLDSCYNIEYCVNCEFLKE